LLTERRRASNEELDFRDMLLVADDIDRVFHPERFTEAERSDKAIGDLTKKAAASPNPVEKWTIGKDQDLRGTPELNDGDALRALTDLKIRFEALEREIHASEIRGEEKLENKLIKEMDNLRSKLEELNSKLTPHAFDL